MKFALIAAVLFALAGPAACTRSTETAGTEEFETAPNIPQSNSNEYFENTLNDAREFVQTEDPRVWMRAMNAGY